MSGIYGLIIEDKYYIGFANDFNKRWHNHRSLLQRNAHHSTKLQDAYNKYGDFTSVILLEATDNLDVLEKEYIEKYDSKDNGYNMTHGGQGGNTYQFQTPEARAARNRKIAESVRKAQLGVPRPNCSQPGDKNGRYRSDVDDEALLSLREQGYSWRAIGRIAGMSHNGVKNRILAMESSH